MMALILPHFNPPSPPEADKADLPAEAEGLLFGLRR